MKLLIALLTLSVWSFYSSAGVFYLPRKIEDVERFTGKMVKVKNYFVPGTKVSWANYDRLKRDFPFLEPLSREQIDFWIVENFAFISEHQLTLGTAYNEPIIVDIKRAQISYRTLEQGRGDTAVVNDLNGTPFGLIDRKGVGVGKKLSERIQRIKNYFDTVGDAEGVLRDADMTNGLLDHAEGIKEAAIMDLEQKVFDIANSKDSSNRNNVKNPRQTIEGYFVLQYPFKAKWLDENGHASIYGRQAHAGRFWHGPVYEDSQGVSLRQTDMFMAWVDGDSAKVKDHALRSKLVKDDILRADNYRFRYETVERFVLSWEEGDSSAIQKYFSSVTRYVNDEWSLVDQNSVQPQEMTPEEVLLWTADLILEDIENRARMALVLVKAQELGMKNVLSQPNVQKVIVGLLNLPVDRLESISESYEPLRRFGVYLIPSISDPIVRNSAVTDEWSKYRGSTLKNLAEVAWMLDLGTVRGKLFKMLRREGNYFVGGLTRKLKGQSIFTDPRFNEFIEMYRLAWSFIPGPAEKSLSELDPLIQSLVQEPPGTKVPGSCTLIMKTASP